MGTLDNITSLASIGLVVGGAYYLWKSGTLTAITDFFKDLKGLGGSGSTDMPISGAYTNPETGDTLLWNMPDMNDINQIIQEKIDTLGKDLTMQDAVRLARENLNLSQNIIPNNSNFVNQQPIPKTNFSDPYSAMKQNLAGAGFYPMEQGGMSMKEEEPTNVVAQKKKAEAKTTKEYQVRIGKDTYDTRAYDYTPSKLGEGFGSVSKKKVIDNTRASGGGYAVGSKTISKQTGKTTKWTEPYVKGKGQTGVVLLDKSKSSGYKPPTKKEGSNVSTFHSYVMATSKSGKRYKHYY